MNKLKKRIKEEWEISSLLTIIFVILFSLVIYVFAFGTGQKDIPPNQPVPKTKTLLTNNYMAYLQNNYPKIEDNGPFGIKICKKKTHPKHNRPSWPWDGNKGRNKNKNKHKQDPPKVAIITPKARPPIPEPPKKKKVIQFINYTGIIEGIHGDQVALISILDQNKQNEQPNTLKHGDKIDIFTIIDFDKHKIILSTPEGKRCTVRKGIARKYFKYIDNDKL